MKKGYIIDACVANILSFVAGTALTWSSPMTVHMERKEESPFGRTLTTEELSWISSMLPVGAIIGPVIFGFLAAKAGRKFTLLICGVPFAVSFAIFALVKTSWSYYVARLLVGMCVGGVFTVMPMYIAEISEPVDRGALGSSINCFICFGFFFSHAAGSYLSITVFNLTLVVFPLVFFVAFGLVASESPNYYAMRQKRDKAKDTLMRIRDNADEAAIELELDEMEVTRKEQDSASFLDIFKSKGLLKAFGMTVGLLFFQQLSGINAVLFYAEDIFIESGSTIEPKICSIIVGTTQFVTSFLTPFVVDRLGRKILLVISATGIILVELPLGVYCYLYEHRKDVTEVMGLMPVVCLVSYIIAFNIGLAILPWSIMGELFPEKVKSYASSAATSITWFVGFFIARYFQPMSDLMGMSTLFWIFCGFCVLLIPFTWFFVIETKGKTLHEIQDELNS